MAWGILLLGLPAAGDDTALKKLIHEATAK
jgi:hypothetical protein